MELTLAHFRHFLISLIFDIVSYFDPPAAGIDRNPALLGRISDLTIHYLPEIVKV